MEQQQQREEDERRDGMCEGEEGTYRSVSGQEQQGLGGEGTEEEEEEGEREAEDDRDGGRGEGEEVDERGVRDGLSLSHTQMPGLEHEQVRQESAVSSKVENGLERDRAAFKGVVGGNNAGTNLPFGVVSHSPSSTLPFVSFSPSNAVQLAGSQGTAHAAAQNRQNGATYGLSGEAILRDDGASARGVSGQDFGDCAVVGSLHEPARIVSGPLHEPLHGTTDADNYYTNLLNSQVHGHHDGLKNPTDTAQDSPGSKRRTLEAHTSAAEPPLRVILADPVTGELMDDAMLLSCGHSVGKGGLRRVMETNVCITCGASVLTETMTPNYALQSAVQAYKREEELAGNIGMKSVKKRREPAQDSLGNIDQPASNSTRMKGTQFAFAVEPVSNSSRTKGVQLPFAAQPVSNSARMKGVQFPFAVNDHVLIMGNKRTPERFVGREAVITTQCLNGWYLVRTLDTGESVRLQYRSLQKSGVYQVR